MTEIAGAKPENETLPSRWPLVVDLDRTLLKTDTLVEQFLVLLFLSPFAALRALKALWSGKAAFKRAVIDGAPINTEAMAVNETLLDYLHQQRGLGRALYLVTAADQRVADMVAAKLGIFHAAVGTNRDHNLKGVHKRDYLVETFPEGFSYAGDSAADISIWKTAKTAVLVGVRPSTRRAVEALDCEIEAEIEGSNRSLRQWARLLRVHQWSKNVLIFVPLFLAHSYFDAGAVLSTLLGFLAMSIMASGTYVINDIVDVNSDRRHRTKRFRPIASGDIDGGMAFVVALVLIASGLAVGAAISLPVAGLLLVYLLITLSYSLFLKRMVMVDIFILASLYTIRILIGVALIGAAVSYWLLMFAFLFFFSLSMAKRHVEIVHARDKQAPDTKIAGRGYMPGDAPLTLATGVSSNMVAVLVLGLYVTNDVYPATVYDNPEWLWGVVSMVFVWSMRIWLLSHRGELNDDPVSFALRDRSSLVIGALAAILFVLSVL